MTRHPGEVHVLDVNGIAGFLYLPTLDAEDACRLLAAVRRKTGGINPPSVLPWPPVQTTARSTPPLIDATRDDGRTFVHAAPLLDALEATRADGLSRRVGSATNASAPVEHLGTAATPTARDARLRPPRGDGRQRRAAPAHARRWRPRPTPRRCSRFCATPRAEQCGANGAAVLKAVANEGELVAAIGPLAHRARPPFRASRFARARSAADARRRGRRRFQRTRRGR